MLPEREWRAECGRNPEEFIKNNLDGKALLSILAEVLGEEEDGWKSDLSSMVEAVAKVRKNQ